MDQNVNAENSLQSKNKAPRIRSVAYPSYTIEASLSLTTKISKEFTDVVYTPRESISKNLKLSGGALLMNLSSCVQYGLLNLKSKEGYKPTELYKKISRPLPDENVNDLMKECLQRPELYKKLLIDFNGKELPALSGLSNILDRKYGVKGNAADIAGRIFYKNLEQLGVLVNNTIDLEISLDDVEVVNDDDDTEQAFNQSQQVQKEQPPLYLLNPHTKKTDQKEDSEFIAIPIPLKDGRMAKLLMPEGYSDEDIIKVHKVITGYLP